jgi:hypothetical protein
VLTAVTTRFDTRADPSRRDGTLPYISNYKWHGKTSMHGRFRERYSSVCTACFAEVCVCAHYPELPLRLLFVGHNPSEHAFVSGYFYSNPTNNMWQLLSGTFGSPKSAPTRTFAGVVPPTWPFTAQDSLPWQLGIGLTDLGVVPGNDAAAYTPAVLSRWREEMYASMRGHVRRVGVTLAHLQEIALRDNGSNGSGRGSGSGGCGESLWARAATGKAQHGRAGAAPPSKRRRLEEASSSCAGAALPESSSTGVPTAASACTARTEEHGRGGRASSTASGDADSALATCSTCDACGHKWAARLTPALARTILHSVMSRNDPGPATGARRVAEPAANSATAMAPAAAGKVDPPSAVSSTSAGGRGGTRKRMHADATSSAAELVRTRDGVGGDGQEPNAAEAARLAAVDFTRPEICAPQMVAFTGKAQWKCLFSPPLK